jgi:hypothetical protein
MKRHLRKLAPLLALVLLAGCSFSNGDLVDAEQPLWEPGAQLALEPGAPVGQTFVARHAGLEAIELFLAQDPGAAPALTLHLRTEPGAEADLAQATARPEPGQEGAFYRFSFPAQSDSLGRYYYAFLEAVEPGTRLPTSGGASYLDGAAYQNHQALDRQLAFRLVYDPPRVALDLAVAGLGGLGLLVVAGLLFVVPGLALLNGLLPRRSLSWAVKLGLAPGISLALYPLLLLWTDLVGLHLGALYAWLPAGLGLLALVWQGRSWRPRQAWERLQQWARSEAAWPDLALLVLVGFVMAVRLVVVRSLDAPLWGDSNQHTLIVKLLTDAGGLFHSWEPYTPLDRFSYHFGFHSAAAAVHWLTGLHVVKATLWTGQLLNGLAVLALYPLALRITGSRWAGVWTVLLAGMLSPLPMAMVNWGRYTQLAGMVILPTAAWLTWEIVDSDERHWLPPVLLALVVSGLALTHYRVLLFYIPFVLALVLVYRDRARQTSLLPLVISAMAATVLFLPWLVNAYGSEVLRMFGLQLTTLPTQAAPFLLEYNAIGPLDSYLSPVWWLTMVLGVGVGLWQRRKPVLVAAVWWFLLLVMTNPGWLGLPGTGAITNFALFISAYLPASLFTGVLAASLGSGLDGRKWRPVLAALAILGLGMWGIADRMANLDVQQHALVTRPDIRAAAWIRENTAANSRFLINSFFAFGGGAVVGSDGGWWLPVLAERQVSVPPLNYASELSPESDLRQRVQDLGNLVQRDLDDPEVVDLLRREGITHIYVGQRQGRVNYGGEFVLSPAELAQSEHYTTVYHQDRVWILALKP